MNAVELADPDPEALASYAGDHLSEDLDTTYGILLDGDHLVLRRGGTDDRPQLRSGVRGVFFVVDFAIFEFRRNPEGEIAGFDLSAGRVKDLRFRRLESR